MIAHDGEASPATYGINQEDRHKTIGVHGRTPLHIVTPVHHAPHGRYMGFLQCCRIYRRIRITAILVFFSLFILFGLPDVENRNWTLAAGESRQVNLGVLNRAVHVTSNVDDGINIYALDGVCPALTGPVVSIKVLSDEIIVAPGAYQSVALYLNQGSYVNMTFLLQSGALRVLLKGPFVSLSQNTPIDQDYDTNNFILADLYTDKVDETTGIEFKASMSDDYTLLFVNDGNVTGKLSATYEENLTSFDLTDKQPIACGATQCRISLLSGSHDCVIVQAKELVTVNITSNPFWFVIVLLAAVPLGILYLFLKMEKMYCTPLAVVSSPNLPEYEIVRTSDPIYAAPDGSSLPVATPVGWNIV